MLHFKFNDKNNVAIFFALSFSERAEFSSVRVFLFLQPHENAPACRQICTKFTFLCKLLRSLSQRLSLSQKRAEASLISEEKAARWVTDRTSVVRKLSQWTIGKQNRQVFASLNWLKLISKNWNWQKLITKVDLENNRAKKVWRF